MFFNTFISYLRKLRTAMDLSSFYALLSCDNDIYCNYVIISM